MKIKIIALLFTCCLAAGNTQAQLSPKIYMDIAELPSMMKRQMIVALLEEDEKVIKRLEKRAVKHPEEIEKYRDEIKSFNDNLKSGMEKYWKLNTKYEYKTMKEVKDIMAIEKKNKSSKYVVLTLGYLEDTDSDVFEWSSISVPVLIYTRAEEVARKPDYKIYIPNGRLRGKLKYSEADIHFALIAMQDNLNHMKRKNDVVKFDDFLSEMTKANCKEMKGKTILIDRELLETSLTSKVEEKIKEKYKGSFKITDSEEIDSAFAQGRENTVVLMCIPYGILKGSTFLPVTVSYLITAKATVDCKTHKLINVHEWVRSGLGLMGKTVSAKIQPRNVEGVSECEK